MAMGEKRVDIHIVIADQTLKAAKIKCVTEDLVLSDVITELLRGWVDGRIKIPKKS